MEEYIELSADEVIEKIRGNKWMKGKHNYIDIKVRYTTYIDHDYDRRVLFKPEEVECMESIKPHPGMESVRVIYGLDDMTILCGPGYTPPYQDVVCPCGDERCVGNSKVRGN